MRKAQVDPFLISSAALSAPEPFQIVRTSSGTSTTHSQFPAGCEKNLLLVLIDEECIYITTVDAILVQLP